MVNHRGRILSSGKSRGTGWSLAPPASPYSYICKYLNTPFWRGSLCTEQPSPTGTGPKATLAAWLGHAGDSALGTDFSDASTPPGPARVPQNAPCLCLLTWEHYQGVTVSLGFMRGGKPQRPRPGVRSLSRAGPAGPRASARRSAVWTFVAHPHRPQRVPE